MRSSLGDDRIEKPFEKELIKSNTFDLILADRKKSIEEVTFRNISFLKKNMSISIIITPYAVPSIEKEFFSQSGKAKLPLSNTIPSINKSENPSNSLSKTSEAKHRLFDIPVFLDAITALTTSPSLEGRILFAAYPMIVALNSVLVLILEFLDNIFFQRIALM